MAYLESAKGGGRGSGNGSPPEAEALLLMNVNEFLCSWET